MGKQCTTCGEVKPPAEFYKNARNKSDGLFSVCKRCHRTRSRERKRRIAAGGPMRLGSRQTVPRATVRPKKEHLYWAAGFLEGEGSFTGSRGYGRSQFTRAGQAIREPLERLQQFFGGTIRIATADQRRFNPGPFFIWQVSGTRARGVMYTLYSMLSQRRREQIRRALSVQRAA